MLEINEYLFAYVVTTIIVISMWIICIIIDKLFNGHVDYGCPIFVTMMMYSVITICIGLSHLLSIIFTVV